MLMKYIDLLGRIAGIGSGILILVHLVLISIHGTVEIYEPSLFILCLDFFIAIIALAAMITGLVKFLLSETKKHGGA